MAVDRARTPAKRRKRRLIATVAALVLIFPFLAAHWPQGSTAWRVIDGDTLDLAGERIRLFGKIISCIRGRGGVLVL